MIKLNFVDDIRNQILDELKDDSTSITLQELMVRTMVAYMEVVDEICCGTNGLDYISSQDFKDEIDYYINLAKRRYSVRNK